VFALIQLFRNNCVSQLAPAAQLYHSNRLMNNSGQQ